jgi:hypothetical protein
VNVGELPLVEPEWCVCYTRGDEDKFLYVKRCVQVYPNEVAIHTGTQKSCRIYASRNQYKASTPSLKRILRGRRNVDHPERGLPGQ